MLFRVIAILSVYFYTSSVWSSNDKCEFNLIENKTEHLECLKKSEFSKLLKQIFVRHHNLKKECSECQEAIVNANKYSKQLKSDFMLLAVSHQSFGGYNLYVIFSGDPLLYKLWIYEIDEGYFQLRSIELEQTPFPVARTIQKLHKRIQFWQKAI